MTTINTTTTTTTAATINTTARIGKVFNLDVQDIGTCRIVNGKVRGKNIKNIVRSIDFLKEVTDKIGDRYDAALAHWPERNIEKGDCWGLFVKPTDKLTSFTYSFHHTGEKIEVKKTEKKDEGLATGPVLNDLDKVLADPDPETDEESAEIEVHPAEPAPAPVPVEVKAEKTVAPKAKKSKKDDKGPKPPKGGSKEKVSKPKAEKKAEKKDVKVLRCSRYAEGVKNFLRRQSLWIEAAMWRFNPMNVANFHGCTCIA